MTGKARDEEEYDISPRKSQTEMLVTPNWFIKSLPPK